MFLKPPNTTPFTISSPPELEDTRCQQSQKTIEVKLYHLKSDVVTEEVHLRKVSED